MEYDDRFELYKLALKKVKEAGYQLQRIVFGISLCQLRLDAG